MIETTKQVTQGQIKFLRALHEHGPMTAKELASVVKKDRKYTHSVVYALRESGVIERTLEGVDIDPHKRGRLSWRYKIAVPLESIEIKPKGNPSRRIPDEELMYAAILRNGGLTGHELQDQFRILYPHRSRKTIMTNILPKARQKGWCR